MIDPLRTLFPAFFMAALLAVLAACAPGADPGSLESRSRAEARNFTCCTDPERMPEPIAQAAGTLSPIFANLLGHAPYRQGHISGMAEARDYLLGQVRPLDILLSSGKNWITGQFVPGHFTHAAVYLGTESQLRSLGLWDAPEVVPHHDEIRAGKVFIEEVKSGASLNDAAGILETDDAVLLRATVSDSCDQGTALRELFARVGTPYDFRYDVSTCDALACTELVALAMPDVGFVVRSVYGVPMLLPDDIAAQAIRGENLEVVAYARGRQDGWSKGSVAALMADITANWGPAPADAPQAAPQRTSADGLAGMCTGGPPRG